MDFAVTHEGLAEGNGRWVIAVDAANERVLLAAEDKTFYWKPLVQCTLFATHTPQQPTLVMAVQAPTQNGLVMAEPNRAMRRNGRN